MKIQDFSVYPLQWGRSPAKPSEIVEVAQHAEELGFYSVTVPHVPLLPDVELRSEGSQIWSYLPPEAKHYQYDALVLLPMIAAATKSIKFGLNVAVTPWLHPFVWAKYLASLDAASGGRVIAGFGLGSAPPRNAGASSVVHDNFGIDGTKRGPMSDEALDVITKLWTHKEPLTFGGQYYRGIDLIVEPRPAQSPYPELWWAGQNIKRSVPRAARYAKYLEVVAWTIPGNAVEAIRTQYVPALDRENVDVGGSAQLCVMIYANVLPANLNGDDLSQRYWNWPPPILDTIAAGTAERCAEVISGLHAAGASHIVLDLQRHGYDRVTELHEQMELFAGKVLPLIAG